MLVTRREIHLAVAVVILTIIYVLWQGTSLTGLAPFSQQSSQQELIASSAAYTVGQQIATSSSLNIGTKTKDDPNFEVRFLSIEKGNEFQLQFFHDSATAQPVAISGISTYALSNDNPAPYEVVTLIVPLTSGKVPKFTLRVGSASEEFSFGESGFGGAGFSAQQIGISSCQIISTPGDYELTQDVSSGNGCINITVSNVGFNCQGFRITHASSGTGPAINVSNAGNVTVRNCVTNATNSTGSTSASIFLQASGNITILNLSARLNGSSGYGIFVFDTAHNVTIRDSTINITASGASLGATLAASPNVTFIGNRLFINAPGSGVESAGDDGTFENNTISVNSLSPGGQATSSLGLFLMTGAERNRVVGNNITINATNRAIGLDILVSGGRHFVGQNMIIVRGNASEGGTGLIIGGATTPGFDNVTENVIITETSNFTNIVAEAGPSSFYRNNILTNLAGSIWISAAATPGSSENQSFTNTTFNNTRGSIRVPDPFVVADGTAVRTSSLNISFGEAFSFSGNLSTVTNLNQSSQITLRGVPAGLNLTMQVDFQDDDTFEACTAPRCVNLSFANGVFVFNVSSWTTYRVTQSEFESCPGSFGDWELSGAYTATSNITCKTITLTSGATLLVNSTAFANNSIALQATENFTVASGASITADITGFKGGGLGIMGSGPGGGNANGGGGGHGGEGGLGSASAGTGGGTYGSALNPITLGSGGAGGNTAGDIGGGGGGAVIITGRRVEINGTISADGQTVSGTTGSNGAGGGAGGTISIVADTLLGNGFLSAKGGRGRGNPAGGVTGGGGGGGGRIFVRYNTSTFDFTSVNVSAGLGGIAPSGTPGQPGKPGTAGFLDMDDDYFRAGQYWRWQSNDKLVWDFATINATDAFTTVLDDTGLNFTSVNWMFFNSSLHAGNDSVKNFTLNISATNFTLDINSLLNLTGTGHRGGALSVAGQGPGGGNVLYGGGGGHGGEGGLGTALDGKGGAPYGSALNPITLGSGGGGGNTAGDIGAAGGGAVIITASRVSLDGTISADGQTVPGTTGSNGAGGGAGGSISIVADTLLGSGFLSAAGGRGRGNPSGGVTGGGGGGGGRIFVRYNTSSFPFTSINVSAGLGGIAPSGTPGKDGKPGTAGLFDTNDDFLTVVGGWRWQLSDEPLRFANVTVLNFTSVRANGTLVTITDTYFSESSNLTVEDKHFSLNATRLIMLNATVNASVINSRLKLVYSTAFNDARTIYTNGSSLSVENRSLARVEWSGNLTLPVANLSANIRLGQNIAFANSSALPGLDRDANITFFGLNFINPVPIIDPEDDGTFVACSASICTRLNYTGGVFTFNVTGFTTYSSNDGALTKTDFPDPVIAGHLLNYTIIVNATGGNISNITLVDTYPPQVVLNASSPAPVSGTNNTFLLGNLSTGQFTTANITVLVSANVSNGVLINNTANITYLNATGSAFSIQVTESTTVLRANTPPSISQVILNSTQPSTNNSDQNLTITIVGASDLDNDPVRNITDWRVNGTSIAVLNYPFESNISSTAAGTILDYSTYRSNGTLASGTNAPLWNLTGVIGGGYEFTSSENDYIEASPPKPSLPLTFEFWVKPTSATPVGIFDSAPGVGNVLRNYPDGQVEWWSGDPVVNLNLSANTWYHLVFIYRNDSGNRRIDYYRDGVLFDTKSGGTSIIFEWSSPIRFGNINGGGAGSYAGTISEIRIYNRSLSAAQIRQNFIEGNSSGMHGNSISSSDTEIGQVWSVAVTPNDNHNNTDGATVLSNNLTITNLTAAQQVSACGTLNSNTTLANSVSANGTCFTINASNIALDCNGNSIFYNQNGGNYSNGIAAIGRTNVTVSNCIIRDVNVSGRVGIAINFTAVNRSLIFNNIIQTNGTNDDYGISLISGSLGNIIANNTIRTKGTSASNYAINLQLASSFNNITGNTIATNGSSANYGIFVAGTSENNLILNNNVTTDTSSSGDIGIRISDAHSNAIINNSILANSTVDSGVGISLEGNTDYSLVAGNTVSTGEVINANGIYATGSTNFINITDNQIIATNGPGVYLSGGTTFIRVIGNNITARGNTDGANTGIAIDTAANNNNTVANNTIRTGGDGINNYGIRLSGAFTRNNFIISNTIVTNGSGGHGIIVELSANGNLFSDNIINATGNSSHGLLVRGSGSNRFVNNSLLGFTGFAVNLTQSLSNIFNNSFLPSNRSLFINETNGSIGYSQPINITTLLNFSTVVAVRNNSIFVNSSDIAGRQLNKSAQLTLRNINFTNPQAIVAFNDATFSTCNAPQCTSISFSGGTFVFNVSSFTTYSSQETTNAPPTIAQVILNTTNPATNDTNQNLTLFVINATDANGDPVRNITDWRVNGTSIAVLNMPFETNVSNVSAAFVRDYSVHGHNGTLGGGSASASPGWNFSGKVGGAFRFDGSNDFISIADSDALTLGNNSFSIALWVNFTSLDSTDALIAHDEGGGTTNKWILYRDGTNMIFHINGPSVGGSDPISAAWSPATGAWQHLVITRNPTSGAYTLYINGSQFANGSSTVVIPNPSASLTIGWAEGPFFTAAVIDEVAIFNRTLTADQVRQLYLAGNSSQHLNTFIHNETVEGETWSVAVTPNDNAPNTDGATVLSNNVTIFAAAQAVSACGLVNSNLTLTNSVSSNGTCFTINASDAVFDCAGFTITGNGTGTAVNATAQSGLTVQNCIIQNFTIGIQFSNVNTSTILNNTVRNSSTGVRLATSFAINLTSNLLNTTAIALHLASSTNSTLTRALTAISAEAEGIGIEGFNNYFTDSLASTASTSLNALIVGTGRSNIFSNVTALSIATTGISSAFLLAGFGNHIVNFSAGNSTAGFAVRFDSTNNTVIGSIMATSNGTALYTEVGSGTIVIGTSLVSSVAVTSNSGGATDMNFVNSTRLLSNGTWIRALQNAGISLTNVTFDALNSSIRYPLNTTVPTIRVNQSNLTLAYNSTFVNSRVAVFLNQTAQITLRGLPFAAPEPLVDFEDDGTFIDCPASVCTEVSYSGGVFVFNVTRFTAYSAQENSTPLNFTNVLVVKVDSPDPVNASSNLTYVINVTSAGNGTAFNVTVNDTLPSQVVFLTSQPVPTTPNNTWFLGNLSPGTTVLINITVLVANVSNGTVLTNTANVSFVNASNATITAIANTSTIVLNAVPLVSICTSISSSTTLVNSVVSNATCFTITADNVTMDCSGYSIIYNADGSDNANGVQAIGRTNVTIKNCIIKDVNASGANGIAINFTSTNSSTILNNTVQTNGTNDNYGIGVFGASSGISINRNTLRALGSSSNNHGIRALGSCSAINITTNIITTNGSTTSRGLDFSGWDCRSIIIAHNTITTYTTSAGGSQGISLSTANATSSLILNNTLTTRALGVNNHGILIGGNVTDTIISNNTISTGLAGTNSNTGIDLAGVSGANITGNFIMTNGSGSRNAGFRVQAGTNGTIFTANTVIADGGVDDNPAVTVRGGSLGNIFDSNNLTTASDQSFAIQLLDANGTVFANNVLSNPTDWINSTINTLNNFTNTTFAAPNGSVRFAGTFALNGTQFITKSRLNVTFNRAFLNSTNLSMLNTTAQIAFYAINFTDPQPIVAFDDTTFSTCNAPQCIEVSFASGVFVFNVSSFTTYSSQETAVALNFSNITVVKTDFPDPVNATLQLNYTINVTSTGNATAFNVTVVDTYPSQVAFVSSQPSPVAGTNNTFFLGNLSPGRQVLINITVLVGNVSNGTVITNVANVSFVNASNATMNAADTEDTTVIAPVTVIILGVNITANATSATTIEGINATYLITIGNNGTVTSTYNITVQNFDGASVAAVNQSQITLAGGASGTVLLSVTNATFGTFRVNVTAILSTNSTINDTTPTITTTVVRVFSVSVSASPSAQSTTPSTTVTYAITLTNNGSAINTYNLTVQNVSGAGTVTINQTNFTLASGSSATATLTVGNSADGTFVVTVTALMATNSSINGTATTTTTVATPVVVPGGAGGSGPAGGVAGGERPAFIKFVMQSRLSSVDIAVIESTPGLASFTFINSSMALYTTDLFFNRKVENATISLFRVDPTPPQKFAELTYQSFGYELKDIGDSVSEVIYGVRVEKSWIAQHDIMPGTTSAWRYDGAVRSALPLEYVSQDENYEYYEISLPRFETFSIAGMSGKIVCGQCPAGAWDECNLLGAQSRDGYECGRATLYTCKPARETRSCEAPELAPLVAAPSPLCQPLSTALPMYIGIVLIAVLVVPITISVGRKGLQVPVAPLIGLPAAAGIAYSLVYCGTPTSTLIFGSATALVYAARLALYVRE